MVTINAPVPVLVLAFAELTVTFWLNKPYTLLVNAFTVAVPADWIALLLVMLDPTMLLLAITKLSDDAPACTKLPPDITLPTTPMPPATISAPLFVAVLALALLTVTFCPNNP